VKFSVSGQKRQPIDLDSIRETLCYIESDIASQSAYASLATHIRAALADIENRYPATREAPDWNMTAAPLFVPMSRT
jgi:hypothetical protein